MFLTPEQFDSFKRSNAWWILPTLDWLKNANSSENKATTDYMITAAYAVTVLFQVLWDVMLFTVSWYLDIDYQYIAELTMRTYEIFLPDWMLGWLTWWYKLTYMDWLDEKAQYLNLGLYGYFDQYMGSIHHFDRNSVPNYPIISSLFHTYLNLDELKQFKDL